MYIIIEHWLTTLNERTNDLHAGIKAAQKQKKKENQLNKNLHQHPHPNPDPTPGSPAQEDQPNLEHYLQTREILDLQLMAPPQCQHRGRVNPNEDNQ